VTRAILIAVLVLACSRPPRSSGEEAQTEGGETTTEETATETSEESRVPGGWAPRNSLARIEGVPIEGEIEERASGTGGVRLIAQLPASPRGDALVELLALPAFDRESIVLTVRAVHDAPRWTSCRSIELAASTETRTLADVEALEGSSAFGLVEGASARTDVETIRWLAASETARFTVCGEELRVEGGGATLTRFVERFAELAGSAE
jgi:hypothetical protein